MPAPQRRETRAAARRGGEPEFQLPFHGPRLMELWERQLGLRSKDILKWIECDEVKQYLFYWIWVFFSVLRNVFNRGYKDESSRLAQQIFDQHGERLSPHSDSIWMMMRKRLLDHAAEAMKVPFAERAARLNERAQSMVDRDNASFHDVWTTVCLKLVALGSNDMGVTKPFYGKDSDSTTCRSVVFELVKSLMDELDFRCPRQKYFETLLNFRCYPLGDGASTLLPFKARRLVELWEWAMPKGPDSQKILPWIYAEYVVGPVCEFLIAFSPQRAPSFIAAMQHQVEDETITADQEEEPGWDTVQMRMGKCFRRLYRAGIRRWTDVTAEHLESLEPFRPWMRPWFAAVFALCTEGSTHMALDRPFYNMDLGKEKCADVCFHLLRKAYRNIVLSRGNGYWARALRKRAPEEAAQWNSLQGNIGDDPVEENSLKNPQRGAQTTSQESPSQMATLSDPPGSTGLHNGEIASQPPIEERLALQKQTSKSRKRSRAVTDEGIAEPPGSATDGHKRRRKDAPTTPRAPQLQRHKKKRARLETEEESAEASSAVPAKRARIEPAVTLPSTQQTGGIIAGAATRRPHRNLARVRKTPRTPPLIQAAAPSSKSDNAYSRTMGGGIATASGVYVSSRPSTVRQQQQTFTRQDSVSQPPAGPVTSDRAPPAGTFTVESVPPQIRSTPTSSSVSTNAYNTRHSPELGELNANLTASSQSSSLSLVSPQLINSPATAQANQLDAIQANLHQENHPYTVDEPAVVPENQPTVGQTSQPAFEQGNQLAAAPGVQSAVAPPPPWGPSAAHRLAFLYRTERENSLRLQQQVDEQSRIIAYQDVRIRALMVQDAASRLPDQTAGQHHGYDLEPAMHQAAGVYLEFQQGLDELVREQRERLQVQQQAQQQLHQAQQAQQAQQFHKPRPAKRTHAQVQQQNNHQTEPRTTQQPRQQRQRRRGRQADDQSCRCSIEQRSAKLYEMSGALPRSHFDEDCCLIQSRRLDTQEARTHQSDLVSTVYFP